MKLFILSAIMCFCAVFCCSCTTYAIGEDGNEYEALSKREIAHLVEISRAALQERLNKGIITRQEYYDAMHNEPMVRIDYRGDRFGTATITWRTRGRKLEFWYDENITSETIPMCSFSVGIIPPQERRVQPDKSIRTGR
ncbi:MAG: hypothetical protein IKC94_00420 [Lentisphaeria bacterium]|nr:hypothetical protein [Lentisphaeria bacterium]